MADQDINTYRYQSLQSEYVGNYLWEGQSMKELTEPETHTQKLYPYSLSAAIEWDNPAAYLAPVNEDFEELWRVDLGGADTTLVEGSVLTLVPGTDGLHAEFAPIGEVDIPGDIGSLEVYNTTASLYYYTTATIPPNPPGYVLVDDLEIPVQIAVNTNIDVTADNPFSGTRTVHIAVSGFTLPLDITELSTSRRFRLVIDGYPVLDDETLIDINTNTVITASDSVSLALVNNRTSGDAILVNGSDLGPSPFDVPYIQMSMAAPLGTGTNRTLNVLPFHVYVSSAQIVGEEEEEEEEEDEEIIEVI